MIVDDDCDDDDCVDDEIVDVAKGNVDGVANMVDNVLDVLEANDDVVCPNVNVDDVDDDDGGGHGIAAVQLHGNVQPEEKQLHPTEQYGFIRYKSLKIII